MQKKIFIYLFYSFKKNLKWFIQQIHSFKKYWKLFIQIIYSFKKVKHDSFKTIINCLDKWIIEHPYLVLPCVSLWRHAKPTRQFTTAKIQTFSTAFWWIEKSHVLLKICTGIIVIPITIFSYFILVQHVFQQWWHLILHRHPLTK